MPFQVYYRKWRPQRFQELVAQDHVSSTLRQAVKQGRVSHSYLFCGPRGTGKTSTARIVAKAVNCFAPQDGDPCDNCRRCGAINEGWFMDLIELDAASNRGIDEIRNIRDRVNLSPVDASYKVYIIDEAHMLTEHASNAFLKTLEEPPPHAIFVLCTTEPQKILPTIISRCQRFDFRRLPSESIVQRLQGICAEEGVDAEAEALWALAHASGGSLRDAENLLEQLAVSGGGRVGGAEVHALLGLGYGELALELTRYLLMGTTSAALSAINRAAWDGVDLRQLHKQAVELMRGVLMLQCGSRDSLDLPSETVRVLEDLAPKASTARVMKTLKLLAGINVRYDMPSPLPLELAVVEACMDEVPEPVPKEPNGNEPVKPMPSSMTPSPAALRPEVERKAKPTTGAIAGSAVTDGPGPVAGNNGRASPVPRAAALEPREVEQLKSSASPPSRPTVIEEAREVLATTTASPGDAVGSLQAQWTELVRILSRYKGKRFNIGALLRDCRTQELEGDTLVLAFAHRSHLDRMQEELDDPQSMKTIEEALVKSLGASYRLRLTSLGGDGAGDAPSPTQSPLVRAALNMGARITEEREQ